MNIYINGIGNVSPQNTLDNSKFLEELVNEKSNTLWVKDPNYKEHISGGSLRRMSRILKIGVHSAHQCMTDAGQKKLDAIITGTGLGCLTDTEKFLKNIYSNDEGVVSPTQFIQSTHNAISAQIALMIQCKNYNFTYTHRGSSFESALLDGMLLIQENAENVLVGGLDELTDSYLKITSRMNMWKTTGFEQLDLFMQEGKGTIAGEGASFFMLGKKPSQNCYAVIKGLQILFKPQNVSSVENTINSLLVNNGLVKEDLDIVILGYNGDHELDATYHQLQSGLLQGIDVCRFKHLCGEYKTASSFGLWTASQILKKQHVPDILKKGEFEKSSIKNVLLYNNYNNSNHSMLLLQHVES